MSKKCAICSSKINSKGDKSVCIGNEYFICERCDTNRRYLVIKHSNPENDRMNNSKAIKYFSKYDNGELDGFVHDIVQGWMNHEKMRMEESIEEKKNQEKKEEAIQFIRKFTTNGYEFAGFIIEEYLGSISSEAVIGTGLLSEIDASLSDFFGEESDAFSDKIRRAKNIATNRLYNECNKLGGNAIIGLNYQITSIANNMVCVSVNGTVIRITK